MLLSCERALLRRSNLTRSGNLALSQGEAMNGRPEFRAATSVTGKRTARRGLQPNAPNDRDEARSTKMPGLMLWLAVVAGGVVVGALVFFGLYRPWQLVWGATEEEVRRAMPGDEVVERPVMNATRAVTVRAGPEEIWPWIVQIGFGRAGWYSYDILDNLGRRSAERIVPELQRMEPGDLVPAGPGQSSGFWVKEVVPNQSMVWWGRKKDEATWTWSLHTLPGGGTRLITRVRAPASWRKPMSLVWLVLLESVDFPMMRKCLLGIKRRAEATTQTVATSTHGSRAAVT